MVRTRTTGWTPDGTVIHFTGEPGSKRHAAIARSPMEEFLRGGAGKVRRYGARDSADAAIDRAESQLGTTGYHLVVNNCEHFVTWCCTGRKVSQQVRGATSLTASVVPGVMVDSPPRPGRA